MADHDTHDHTGIPGTGAPTEITDVPTAETDTGLVLRPDGAGGVEWAVETGGSGVVSGIQRLTSGDVTITATTNVVGSNITGLGDITLACETGDLLEVGISALFNNATANSGKFDVCTVVSAAAVNFFSNGTGTGATNGCMGWYCNASSVQKASGSMIYVAQAGDISGGNVVLRLLCFLNASSRVVSASTASPLVFWAVNHRQ